MEEAGAYKTMEQLIEDKEVMRIEIKRLKAESEVRLLALQDGKRVYEQLRLALELARCSIIAEQKIGSGNIIDMIDEALKGDV